VSYIPATGKSTLFVPTTKFAGVKTNKGDIPAPSSSSCRTLALILSLAAVLASAAFLTAYIYLYQPQLELESLNGPDICSLPPQTGPCRAAMPRWYKDSKSGSCAQFLYGGCEGNANNFVTLAECERACAANFGPYEEVI